MRYNCYIHVQKIGMDIEGFHKHYKHEMRLKDNKMVAGRALIHRIGHSRYYKGYSLNSRMDKLKTLLHAVDWSLDKFLMDAYSGKLSSKDTINIYINNKELVPYLNSWNKKAYYKDDILVNRELFKVVQTIRKIRQKAKVGISFHYVPTSENKAEKLVNQYDFRYNHIRQRSYILEQAKKTSLGRKKMALMLKENEEHRRKLNYEDFLV